MSEERKIKLEDLDNEAPQASTKTAPPKVDSSPKKEPRIEKMKNLSHEEKVEMMKSTWYFDRPNWTFGWLIFVCLVFAAEYLEVYDRFLVKRAKLHDLMMGFEEVFSDVMTLYMEKALQHPIIFLLLGPIFFRFKRTSDYFFVISFDGISTVNKITADEPHRKSIKWNEIVSVKKAVEEKRNILVLNGTTERIGVVIWDIDDDKKKAIRLLLKSLIAPNHPFREFVEKEKL